MRVEEKNTMIDEISLLMQELIEAYKDFIDKVDKALEKYPELKSEAMPDTVLPESVEHKEEQVVVVAPEVKAETEPDIRITQLAVRIDAFSAEFDPFEYEDVVESKEDHIAQIEENLLSGGDSLISYFQDLVEADILEDDIEEAREILDQILEVQQNLRSMEERAEELEAEIHAEEEEHDKEKGGIIL